MKKSLLDNKVVTAMFKIADLMIISLYWFLLCIPVITIIPASSALYYACVKAVRRDRGNLTAEFFKAFRQNLKQGMLLSVIYIIIGIVLYTYIDFARGVKAETGLGRLYTTLTISAAVIITIITLYLIPALSRFEVKITGLLRLSLYFASRNLLTLIPLIFTLAAAAAAVYCFPPLILIVPGVYCYLLSYSVEAAFKKYINDNLKPEERQGDMWYME